jgi:hypothetical protein
VDAVAEEVDCGHGRVEQQTYSVIADLSLVEKAAEWASLQGLVRIESERHHKATGKTERATRNALCLKTLQPQVPCRAADLKLPAKHAHRLAATGTNHKIHTLIQQLAKPP